MYNVPIKGYRGSRPRLVVPGETTDTSNHRHNSSVDDKGSACGLGCKRRWRWWALSSTSMLWSFSQFRGTAAESEQFGDGRAWVGNIFGTLEVMIDAADEEWDCWTSSVARHTSEACTWIDGPKIKFVTKTGNQLGKVEEGRDQRRGGVNQK